MSKITYEIVPHDGGWAYRADGVYSETFPSHDAARKAAERAAREQVVPGNTTGISWEDKEGRWHEEVARGDDRPETDVFVLDDGFQHRRAARDLDIVLLSAADPFGGNHVLPRGLLREPVGSFASEPRSRRRPHSCWMHCSNPVCCRV